MLLFKYAFKMLLSFILYFPTDSVAQIGENYFPVTCKKDE